MTDEVTTTPLHRVDEYEREFDPDEYLEHFFSESAVAQGVKTALFALPLYLRRIALTCYEQGKFARMLDVGAGPTIHSAICAREFAKEIYLSDYTARNINELRKWREETSTFDWRPVLRCVAVQEGVTDIERIEIETRNRVKGVYFCNVHLPQVIDDASCTLQTHEAFDVVVSIFCLESACTNMQQYNKAMANIVSLIRPGGHLIFGSVLEDTVYEFGKTRFELLYLTEESILSAMEAAGLDLSTKQAWENEGAYMIMIEKKR